MIPDADLTAAFVERIKLERIAAGLPATIIDDAALRLIAALVAAKPVAAAYYCQMAQESEAVSDEAT